MIDSSKDLIYLLNSSKKETIQKKFDDFYSLYVSTISKVPIFGYFLFETISRFIALHQKDERSIKYQDLGEIYVGNFKDITFKTIPTLSKDFNLGLFAPDLNLLRKEFEDLHLVFFEFEEFLIEHTIYCIREYLFNGDIKPDFFAAENNLIKYGNICPSFVGHILQ